MDDDGPWKDFAPASDDGPWNDFAPSKQPVTSGEAQSKPISQKLMETWPVRAAQDIYHAVTAPGDVATGKFDVAPSGPPDATGKPTWSEEDEARLQMSNATIADRARTLATLGPTSAAARAGEGAMGAPVQRAVKPQPVAPLGEELEARAEAGYKHPEVQDVKIKSSAGPRLADEVITNFNTPEIGISEELAPKTFGIMKKLQNIPQNTEEGGPDPFLTVNNLRTVRRMLGRAASDPDKTERFAAKSAIDHLDEFLANLPAEDVIQGNPQAAAAILKEANANYAAMSRAADLDTRMIRAQIRAAAANSGMNIGNTIRQRMADILVNPKLRRGFNADELDQMSGIVFGTKFDNALRAASNITGGGGGLLSAMWSMSGAHAMPVAGYLLRKASNFRAASAADKLNESVRLRSPLGAERAAATKAIEQDPLPTGMAIPSVGHVAPSTTNAMRQLFESKVQAEPDEGEDNRPPSKHKHGGGVNQQEKPSHKLTHAAVGYVDKSKHLPDKCGRCVMFRGPTACTLVRSPISNEGWCRRFEGQHAQRGRTRSREG